MNTKNVVVAVLLTVVLSIAGFAQHNHSSQQKSKSESMLGMMGAPTFEKSIDGIHIAVWLITQDEHKKTMHDRMKGKDHGMQMGHAMMHGSADSSHDAHMMHDMEDEGHHATTHTGKGSMEAMMAGTHHIMVAVTDEEAKAEVKDAEVKITVTPPSKKSSSATLARMMSHFGAGISLDEKGAYTIAAMVMVDGKHFEGQFSYEVK